MAKPRLAQTARDDIRSIRNYSKAVFGAPVAIEYVNALRAALNRLGDRPLIGIAEEGLGEGVRSFGFRSHRVYYRVETDLIRILRILHQAQDAPATFGETH